MSFPIDPAQHAAHLIDSFTSAGEILLVISIAIGMSLFIGGIMLLKRYGEMRTFMSHQMTVWQPLAMMFGGVMFLILPWFINTGLLAFWGDINPMHYAGDGNSMLDQYIPVINLFVRVIGVGAIMRAISLMARSGGHGGQPGTMSRSLFYFLSGIICVHIVTAARLFKAIFDFT